MGGNMPKTWDQTYFEIFSVIGKPLPTNYFLYFLAGMLVGNPWPTVPPNSFSHEALHVPITNKQMNKTIGGSLCSVKPSTVGFNPNFRTYTLKLPCLGLSSSK
jgi:hypothetical protein